MELTNEELQAIYDLIFMVLKGQQPTERFKEHLDVIHKKIGIHLNG